VQRNNRGSVARQQTVLKACTKRADEANDVVINSCVSSAEADKPVINKLRDSSVYDDHLYCKIVNETVASDQSAESVVTECNVDTELTKSSSSESSTCYIKTESGPFDELSESNTSARSHHSVCSSSDVTCNSESSLLRCCSAQTMQSLDTISTLGEMSELDVAGTEDESLSSSITSGIGTVTSDIGTVSSGIGTVTPDIGAVTSGVGTVTSGVSTVISDIGSVKSDIGAVTSGVGTVTSGVGTVTSGVDTVTSDIGTVTPDIGAVTSDISTIMSDIGSVKSDIGSVTSGVGTVTSDIGSVTPDIGAVTSDIGTVMDSKSGQLTDIVKSEVVDLSDGRCVELECQCGAHYSDPNDKLHVVECEHCQSHQHAACVNYDLADPLRGNYLCPHCRVVEVCALHCYVSGCTDIMFVCSVLSY